MTKGKGDFLARNVEDKADNTKKQLCVALLAHVDAGKTTLSEAMLYQAGMLRQMGRVDNGDAFLDTYSLEKERGITIFSKQAVLELPEQSVTLLDTPGHVDFSAEMERTLQVADYGILVISGADGVQGHTKTLWRLLARYQVPCLIFVNKMDQPGTDRESLLMECQKALSVDCVDFTQKPEQRDEAVALCQESLLDVYMEEGSIPETMLRDSIRSREVFPVYFGSALKMQGIGEFLEGIQHYLEPLPYPEEFGARVFKIARDEKGNRITYVKVTGGEISNRMLIGDKKVTQIRRYSGSRFETCDHAPAGMICGLTGLSSKRPGDGMGREQEWISPLLEPVLTYRINLPDTVSAVQLLPKMRELEEEAPELHVVWKEELQEIQVQVMGQVQIEVLQKMIAERFSVDVTFDTGNIVYKETIAEPVEGVGHFEPLRHYAEVHIWMEPGAPGSGVVVDSTCSEDALDKNWQRLILSHILERQHPGVLMGCELTDVKITLTAGRAHLKHTEGGDFRQATYRAIRHGLMNTKSVLLEPYYQYTLEVPDEMVGRAITDIERMAGTFSLESQGDGESVLNGEAPVSTMRDYASQVHAYTKGLGKFSCVFSGYRPCHNEEEVVTAAGYDPEQDVENPAGSIFCAHGAGFHVPWQDVTKYMHLHTGLGESEQEETEPADVRASTEEMWIDVEEIDAILNRATHANGRKSGEKTIRRAENKPVGLSKPRKKEMKKGRYMLVDGYNVIFAWPELAELAKVNIDSARGKLMDILCDYQGYSGYEMILVFDAYRVQNHATEMLTYHNICVVYTKEAETADQYIEKFAHKNAKDYHITVVTSDGLEQVIIRGSGCRLLSSREFQGEVKRQKQLAQEYLSGSES